MINENSLRPENFDYLFLIYYNYFFYCVCLQTAYRQISEYNITQIKLHNSSSTFFFKRIHIFLNFFKDSIRKAKSCRRRDQMLTEKVISVQQMRKRVNDATLRKKLDRLADILTLFCFQLSPI